MSGWQILVTMIGLVEILIFVRVILSWVMGPYPRNPLAAIVYQVTDPILEPVRRILPDLGPMDISPLVAGLLLEFIRRLIITNMMY